MEFLRLLVRRPLGQALQPMMDGIDADDLDEISYRAIAIGFPIFTLGAFIFAMIWAQIAWSLLGLGPQRGVGIDYMAIL